MNTEPLNPEPMNPKPSEEKIKPFRLVKYFTFISLIFIFLGTIVLSFLNTHWARNMLLKKSEDYALLLVENLNHQVFSQFILPVAWKYGKIQLREKEQHERMDEVVRSTLHSFKIDTVNIYDMNNVISYSFDQELIGRTNAGGKGYQMALTGKSSSELIQRGGFWEILVGFPKESRMTTFAPIRPEPLSRISESVLGVVEIVQDLSEDYQKMFSFQILVVSTSTLVMGVLFFSLVFVVKRGEAIIEQRALERLRLKEKLGRAERLSSLGEMVAGVSHEIRNPLGIIRSSAELLRKKMAQLDPANPIPGIIVEESSKLNNVITDFLDFAKPKNPHLRPCRITEVLDKTVSFFHLRFPETRVNLVSEYADSLPEISADSDMLYHAFSNVLLNAAEAMPDGGMICIRAALNGRVMVLTIEDEGSGIAEEVLEKIWDPFFTTKEKGTGLGLGIVKNIIESHGGSVLMENRAVRGAVTRIELPV